MIDGSPGTPSTSAIRPDMFAGPMFLNDRPAKVDSGSDGAGAAAGRDPCACAVAPVRTDAKAARMRSEGITGLQSRRSEQRRGARVIALGRRSKQPTDAFVPVDGLGSAP